MSTPEHKREHWRWVGPALRRLRIKSYKSIDACDVALQPLSVLVGRNGAGKSNVLDAIAFVADATRTTLAEAIAARGGLETVRRRSTGHPRIVVFELELRLPSWQLASYRFAIETRADGGFVIRGEVATLRDDGGDHQAHFARDDRTIVRASLGALPPPDPDRLHLTRLASFDDFRPLYDALATMRFYRFDLAALRAPSVPGDGAVLAPDGANLASVVARLGRDAPATLERVSAFLGAITPGIVGVERVTLGPYETVQFRQTVAGARYPWKLPARDMSNGTLRALAILVAAFQDAEHRGAASLIGLETPETDLHPAALPALVEALQEAAANTQILATSHSPALVDALDPAKDALILVESRDGTSRVAATGDGEGGGEEDAPDAAGVHPTAGDLLRLDRLRPRRGAGDPRQDQLSLFDAGD